MVNGFLEFARVKRARKVGGHVPVAAKNSRCGNNEKHGIAPSQRDPGGAQRDLRAHLGKQPARPTSTV